MNSIVVIICMGCKRNHNETRDVASMAEKCGAKQVICLSLSLSTTHRFSQNQTIKQTIFLQETPIKWEAHTTMIKHHTKSASNSQITAIYSVEESQIRGVLPRLCPSPSKPRNSVIHFPIRSFFHHCYCVVHSDSVGVIYVCWNFEIEG